MSRQVVERGFGGDAERAMRGRLTYTVGGRALGCVLTVEAGWEPKRKLAFFILGSTQDMVVSSK